MCCCYLWIKKIHKLIGVGRNRQRTSVKYISSLSLVFCSECEEIQQWLLCPPKVNGLKVYAVFDTKLPWWRTSNTAQMQYSKWQWSVHSHNGEIVESWGLLPSKLPSTWWELPACRYTQTLTCNRKLYSHSCEAHCHCACQDLLSKWSKSTIGMHSQKSQLSNVNVAQTLPHSFKGCSVHVCNGLHKHHRGPHECSLRMQCSWHQSSRIHTSLLYSHAV